MHQPAPLLRVALRAWPFVLAATFAGLYAAYGLERHARFESNAFDLGIFDQAVWHYSRLQAPASSVRGVTNLLGDHFHPVLALAAPAYWIWDDVRMLLVLQAVLVAASGIPLYLLARRSFGDLVATLWTVAYLLYWGLQNAIAFDFHEIAFAVPLIAFAIYFVQLRRFVAALPFILALLLVKEDLSVLVAAFGVLYVVLRRWRLGAALVAAGVAWFFLATKVLIPALGDGRGFRYWTYGDYGDNVFEALRTFVTHPRWSVSRAISPEDKLTLLRLLFAPFLFLSVLSPLFILAVPLLLERLLSGWYPHWQPGGHYSATIAPVVAFAALDGLGRLNDRLGRTAWLPVAVAVAIVAVAVVPSSGLLRPRTFPLGGLVAPERWAPDTSLAAGDEMLALIPPDASVLAQDSLVPHLTHRDPVYVLVPPELRERINENPFLDPGSPAEPPDYVAANMLLPCAPLDCRPGSPHGELLAYLASLPDRGYGLVYSRGPWLLYRRGAPSTASLSAEARRWLEPASSTR